MSESLKIIGSSIAKLRALLSESRKDLQRIQTLLSSLTETLDTFWDNIDPIVCDEKLWRETISVLATGRALTVAAQAEEALSAASSTDAGKSKTWVSNGEEYVRWLGGGVLRLLTTRVEGAITGGLGPSQLCGKALSLGHNGMLTFLYTCLNVDDF